MAQATAHRCIVTDNEILCGEPIIKGTRGQLVGTGTGKGCQECVVPNLGREGFALRAAAPEQLDASGFFGETDTSVATYGVVHFPCVGQRHSLRPKHPRVRCQSQKTLLYRRFRCVSLEGPSLTWVRPPPLPLWTPNPANSPIGEPST